MSQQLCHYILTLPKINCPSCGNIGADLPPPVNIEIMKLIPAQRPQTNCIFSCYACSASLCNVCSKDHYKNTHNN